MKTQSVSLDEDILYNRHLYACNKDWQRECFCHVALVRYFCF